MKNRPSLKSLAGGAEGVQTAEGLAPPLIPVTPGSPRSASTRDGSRQVSGHFKAEVAQSLRMLAAEQDREQQELLAEALNMLFERYGKVMRAEVLGSRRRKL